MNMLGRCYAEGWSVNENTYEANQWFRKAAEAGNSWGMYNLGYNYLYGKCGLREDNDWAVYWLKKSAEAGNKSAMGELAKCYENGWGVYVDHSRARYWRNKASDD